MKNKSILFIITLLLLSILSTHKSHADSFANTSIIANQFLNFLTNSTNSNSTNLSNCPFDPNSSLGKLIFLNESTLIYLGYEFSYDLSELILISKSNKNLTFSKIEQKESSTEINKIALVSFINKFSGYSFYASEFIEENKNSNESHKSKILISADKCNLTAVLPIEALYIVK